jgi:hypothetical protein
MDGTAVAILIVGLGATVAAMALPAAYPNAPIIFWKILLWAGILGTLVAGAYLARGKINSPKFLPVVVMAVGLSIFLAGAIWYFSAKNPVVSAYLPKPLTLRNLFDTDFMSYAGYQTTAHIELRNLSTPTGDQRDMPWKALWDREAKSSFLSFFIEAYPADIRRAISQAKFIFEHYRDFLKESENSIEFLSPNREGDTAVIGVKDLTFSGLIYLYIPDFLTIEQQNAITQMFKEQNLSVIIRGEYYRRMHSQEDRPNLQPAIQKTGSSR